MSNNDKTCIVYYLRKSVKSVDKYSKDDPQITQIRADSSTGGQI